MLTAYNRTPTLPPQPSIYGSYRAAPKPSDKPLDPHWTEARPTELVDLCEPVFRFMCQLSRAGKVNTYDFAGVRREITGWLRDARSNAVAIGPLMAAQFEKVELILVSFVDFIIVTSPLPFAREWSNRRLAYEMTPPCMTGDQEFFHQLDRTLTDPSDAATERLMVFYHCMGLGFSGMYFGRADAVPLLRRKMQECATRLRDRLDPEDASICPEAYIADAREAHFRFPRLIAAIVVIVLGLWITLYAASLVAFKDQAETYSRAAANVTDPTIHPAESNPSGQ